MKQFLVPSVVVVSFMATIGCAKPEVDLSAVTIGMTRAQVIERLGKPTRVSVIRNLEVFEYEAYDTHMTAWSWAEKGNFRKTFVRFIDGNVESFGNKGDFDSTKDPTSKVVIDQKVQVDKREELVGGKPGNSTVVPFDLKSELEKLEQMKKNGLISESEFKELRQRAIDKAKVQ